MIGNSLKPLNVLCVVCYVIFMGFALDSNVVNALVFYISDENNPPVYITGKFETREVNQTGKKQEPIVAIQYRQTNTATAEELDIPNQSHQQAYTEEKVTQAKIRTKPELSEPEEPLPSAVDFIKAIEKNKWEYAILLDRYIVNYDPETYIVLTIRPELQRTLEDVFKKNSTRLGAGIIQDPSTGEVLALTSTHKNQILSIGSDKFTSDNWALKATFPVASIFKIIVAAAGIDSESLTANSRFRAWKKSQMTVWRAFATSHNGVFGHMARKAGQETLEKYAKAFGFNKNFFFDLPVGKSIAEMPTNSTRMGQAAAGLNRDFLVSPMHVASIVSTVLNRGRTMKPILVDYVVRKNRVIFRRQPFQLGQPIKLSTARDLYKMFYATTAIGTGRRGFGGYSDCPDLAKICGGKTGTLTGNSPNYLYTWFGGFTKATGRDLCIVLLAGQPNHTQTKASSIAGQLSYELWQQRNKQKDQVVSR